jgi:hypothetical protein
VPAFAWASEASLAVSLLGVAALALSRPALTPVDRTKRRAKRRWAPTRSEA